jgi:hypothetical protein
MRLCSGSSQQFIEDAVHNQIAGKLKRAISMVFDHAGLTDHGVLLEYQLPLTSRCLTTSVPPRPAVGRRIGLPESCVGQPEY